MDSIREGVSGVRHGSMRERTTQQEKQIERKSCLHFEIRPWPSELPFAPAVEKKFKQSNKNYFRNNNNKLINRFSGANNKQKQWSGLPG
jgi:hypothetical protein